MIETYYTKKELSIGIKQNKFYYKVINSNNKRGYNKTIKVYMLCKDYSPLCIGHADVNTASFKGDKPTANDIIKSIFKYQSDGYNEESLNGVIYARTGYNDISQLMEEY